MSIRLSGGEARGARLPQVKEKGTRPTSNLVRSAVFSMVGDSVAEARVVDLFAGTGAYGLEALSRGAAWVDFVEANPRQCAALRAALQQLQYAQKASIYCAKVERAPVLLHGAYDLLFLDPPYAYAGVDQLVERIARSPLVGERTLLVWEHSRHHAAQDTYGPLALHRRRRYGDTVVSIYAYGRRGW